MGHLSPINDAACAAEAQRSARNWFFDAGVLAGDGEIALAKAAALRAIEALDALDSALWVRDYARAEPDE